ncbi:hypothetical protein TNCV_4952061 [Trichonephila clavipes]|nr:hypothetical protein TNCV_4952061 [Trichonephila clavipes]
MSSEPAPLHLDREADCVAFEIVGIDLARPLFLKSREKNDITLDVACHRYTLNMQVSSETKNNSSPNEPSRTINGVLLVVTGTWHSPY